jgi:spermidine/putrescine transport system substrate-binding protein
MLFIGCTKEPTAPPSNINQVILYNWAEYTSLSVIKEFEKETGIKVIIKTFDTIEEQLAKLESNPQFCDLTVLDSYKAKKKYLNLKVIQKIDIKRLKHQNYKNPFKDFNSPGIPYAIGLTGFAINSKFIKEEITDYSFLLDPQYKNKISLLDDPEECYLALARFLNFDLKVDPDLNTQKELEDTCLQFKENEITLNDTLSNLDLLTSGEKWIVQTYSGDFANAQLENEHIQFVNPKGDIHLWAESICLVKNSANKGNAYKLLNFLSRPKSAATFSNEFLYTNGIMGSDDFMLESTKSNPLVNIPETTLKKGDFYLVDEGKNSIMQKLLAILKVKTRPKK